MRHRAGRKTRTKWYAPLGIDLRIAGPVLVVLAGFAAAGFGSRDRTPVEPPGLTGVASVIDGDTIEIRTRRIRLEGIDALESGQTCRIGGREARCGRDAAMHLSNRIGRKTVRCTDEGRDRYGRTLGTCFQGGEDINAMMVRDGQALAYRRYSRRYIGEEDAAREARRGIWSGEFEAPWDWRRR